MDIGLNLYECESCQDKYAHGNPYYCDNCIDERYYEYEDIEE